LEERAKLLQTAKPMFTVLNYGTTISNKTNTFNTASYNTFTYSQPPQKSEIIQKVEQVKKIMKEDHKAKTNLNKDTKKAENIQNEKQVLKAEKKVEQQVEKKVVPKEEKKVEQKFQKNEEKKVAKREEKKVEYKNLKNTTSTSRYVRRDGNRVIHKAEKIRQSSVNKNDKGKKHHLTFEFINILVEKPE
jgi:hypothetical protein